MKLIYFETLGYDTSFAHILPINLCQTSNMYLKKMAYLLAALLVKPGDKLCVLMHNTILKDLQSENSFVVMTSLTMLRYFLTSDLVPPVLPLLTPLLKHQIPIIKRKSNLVILDIHQRFSTVPNLTPLKPQCQIALNDSDPPVMFAGLSMAYWLVRAEPHKHKDLTKRLTEILWHILDGKYPK